MAKRPVNPELEADEASTTAIRELPLVALRETVIFPEMIVPLTVGREKSVAALNAAVAASGGYCMAMCLLALVRERTELSDVPSLARGTGHLRLKNGRIWTLLTTMQELKGFEEPVSLWELQRDD